MNHDIHAGRSRQSGTLPPRCLPLQCQLKRQLPNIHGRHPKPVIRRSIILHYFLGLLVGDNARASATSPPWPTESAFVVVVGHRHGILQA